jgi:hypothetical protein
LVIDWVAQNQAVACAQCLLAGAREGRLVAPLQQQIGHRCHVAGPRGCVFGLVEIGNQLRVERGGFAQIAHPATALEVGQSLRRSAHRDRHKRAHKVVLRQDEAASLAGAAVGAGEAPAVRQDCVAIVGVGVGAGQPDAGDAGLRQRLQLTRLAHAVLVQIAPDAQVAELRVFGIEHAVTRAHRGAAHGAAHIQLAQRGKAVGGLGAVGQDGLITKQLAPGIDQAVAVAVPHQHAVIGPGPSGAGLDGVAIGIKQHAIGQWGDLQPVAVEVEDQRVDVDDGFDKRVGGGANRARNNVMRHWE